MKNKVTRGQNFNKVEFNDEHIPTIVENESNVSDYLDNMVVSATPTMYAAAEDHKRNMEHMKDVQDTLLNDAESALAPTDADKKACGHHRTDRYITHERLKNMYVNPDKFMKFPKITESIAYNKYLNEKYIILEAPHSDLKNGCDWVQIGTDDNGKGRYFWVNLEAFNNYNRVRSGKWSAEERRQLNVLSDNTLSPMEKYVNARINLKKSNIKKTFYARTNQSLLYQYTKDMEKYYSSHRELDGLDDDKKFDLFLDYYSDKLLRDEAEKNPEILNSYEDVNSLIKAKRTLLDKWYLKAFTPSQRCPDNCVVTDEYPYPDELYGNDDIVLKQASLFLRYKPYFSSTPSKNNDDESGEKDVNYSGLSFQDYIYAILYDDEEEMDSRLQSLEGVKNRARYFGRRAYELTMYMDNYKGIYRSALDMGKVAIIPVSTSENMNTRPSLAGAVASRFNLSFKEEEHSNAYSYFDKMYVITLQAGEMDLSKIDLNEISRVLKKTRIGNENSVRIGNLTEIEKSFAENAFGYKLDSDGVTLKR